MHDTAEQLLSQVRRGRGPAAPAAALAAWGLGDDPQSARAWAVLDAAEWLDLLAGLAAIRPAAAALLAARCLADRLALPPGEAAALWAAGDAEFWQIHDVPSTEPPRAWHFIAAGRLWRAPQATWRELGPGILECPRGAADPAALPPGAAAEQGRLARALLQGCVDGAFAATLDHARERHMFGRRMADIAAIQWRLLQARERASRGDIAAFRVEIEQVCGGSGFMVETAAAQALDWLIRAEAMTGATLRPPCPEPGA